MTSFRWRDGDRLIRFGRGSVGEAVELLGGPGYALLTTERAADAAPHVPVAADEVHMVEAGPVPDLAGDLLGSVRSERVVALGGGRVVDVAKAIAAARGVRAMAIPTTLAGAEMTRGHRHARGVDESRPRARCSVVVNDPALSASQPVKDLAASSLNALGHAAEALCVRHGNPVVDLVAAEAARLLVGAFARTPPDRDALALGALLGGYALDASALGLHHVLAQTLVREAGVAHGPANAVMLPHTLGALEWRFPAPLDALAATLGESAGDAASRVAGVAGATRLSELGVDADVLPACADAAARRDALDNTPPRADRAEILALYEHAL
ncbi:MAG TPA: iron-containing alcohol dehydrogenase [Solirubrobacteraceae bacterium]